MQIGILTSEIFQWDCFPSLSLMMGMAVAYLAQRWKCSTCLCHHQASCTTMRVTARSQTRGFGVWWRTKFSLSSLLSLRLNDHFFSSPPTNFHSGGKPSIKILMFLHDVDDSFAIIQVLVKNNQMNITDLPQIPHCNQGKKNGDGHTHSFLLSPEFLVVRGEVEEKPSNCLKMQLLLYW